MPSRVNSTSSSYLPSASLLYFARLILTNIGLLGPCSPSSVGSRPAIRILLSALGSVVCVLASLSVLNRKKRVYLLPKSGECFDRCDNSERLAASISYLDQRRIASTTIALITSNRPQEQPISVTVSCSSGSEAGTLQQEEQRRI